jgi:hypothetical protein
MTLSRRLALIIVLVILAAAGATPALAGEYPVYACEPAVGDVNHSWNAETNHGGMTAYANCPPPATAPAWNRGLVTRHGINPTNPNATVPRGSYAALVFRAPPGAGLSRITFTHSWCGFGGFRSGIANAAGAWLLNIGPSWCGLLAAPQVTHGLGGTNAIKLRTVCVTAACHVGTNARGWATLRSATVWVADYTAPQVSLAGGSALAPGWRRGILALQAGAADNVGIRSVQVLLAGNLARWRSNQCNHTLAVPCPNLAAGFAVDTRVVPDGRRLLAATAQDSAGNLSTSSTSILVDNTSPAAPIDLSLTGGTGWRQQNSFSIGWSNPSQSGKAPIAHVAAAVCPASNGPEVWTGCRYRTFKRANARSLSGLQVPRAGIWAGRVWLIDAAGNGDHRTARTVPLRFDGSPPQIALQRTNPADPGRISVRATDTVSGIARAEIEIRRRGAASWSALQTTRTGSGFSAYMDDEHIADGVYDVRARAVDAAGNERSTDRDTTGALVTRTVPLRINTRLVAGQIKRVGARRSRGKRRTRRKIVVRPTVRYGRTIPIQGRLTTPGANPIANANVEVWQRTAMPGATWRRIALISTDRNGRFTFKALRGPSRRLRFRYPGTPLVRARTTEVDLHVKAGTSLGVSRRRVVNGDEVVFRGTVRGRPLPSTGKLLQLQAYSRGTWLTFATPRADAETGMWRWRYRFTATRGTVRYRFRARVPREAGFPFDAGASRRLGVTVRGL